MKKLSLALVLLLAVGACKKNEQVATATLSTEEAAELSSSALSTSNNGFASVALDITANSQAVYDLKLNCGANKGYTASHQSPANAAVSYNYAFTYSYTVNCNANNIADNITGNATEKGTFDGPRLSASHTGQATFRIAGLVPTSTVYVVDADYRRTGSFTAKSGNKTSGNTNIALTISNYSVNKQTKIITSGTGTIALSGTTDKGAKFEVAGTVTFTNDGNATLVISGVTYIVNLTTGAVTKK